MALPKLLQKLFTNGGAGDKLNQNIIPDIPYSKVTDAPSVDSALSSTSENPVQNKVINAALGLKANTSALATVATSGNYNDLRGKPTIPVITSGTTDLTAGSSALATGAVYLLYE